MMTEESVDADSKVGADSAGRHDKHVTPASCPISNASRVTENRWKLESNPKLDENRTKVKKRLACSNRV